MSIPTDDRNRRIVEALQKDADLGIDVGVLIERFLKCEFTPQEMAILSCICRMVTSCSDPTGYTLNRKANAQILTWTISSGKSLEFEGNKLRIVTTPAENWISELAKNPNIDKIIEASEIVLNLEKT